MDPPNQPVVLNTSKILPDLIAMIGARGSDVADVWRLHSISVGQESTDQLQQFLTRFQKSDQPTSWPRFLSLDPLLYDDSRFTA